MKKRIEDYVHLHVHSEYSALDGMGTVDQYAARAAEIGQRAIALTDHGCMDGLIKFQKACQKHEVKPILGCELYVVPNLDRNKLRGHACVWIKNETGFRNLCKILTFANTEGFYYKPRVTFEILLKYCEGLCISTACLISFANVFKEGKKLFRDLYDSIGNDLYVEVMPHDIKKQFSWNKEAIKLARKYGIKVLATNDCHYVRRWHHKAQEVLLAIQRKAKMDDPNRFRFSIKGLYLKKAKEMELTFKNNKHKFRREYLRNTLEVAEKCSGFTIAKQDIALPRVPNVPINPSKARAFLWDLCNKGYVEKCGHAKNIKRDKLYYNRLKEEYDLIIEKKFERYFLMVWETVNWCKENNILVGPGRGSVGGSIMAYLLGITSVNSIEHDLIFSRFINKDRIDYPDIDIDFEHTKRHLVRQHLETVYGHEKVAAVSSFNRMKAKAVLKDVGRAFGVHWSETEAFTKLVEDNDDHTGIHDAIEAYSECAEYAAKYPKVITYAKQLEGQVRGYGQHAAALVISREPIGTSGRCNLRTQEGLSIVNWEKEDTEYVGLMKLDALGLKLLSILSETKKLIRRNYSREINLEKIDLNDKKVFKEISDGKTTGVFQLGTYAMTSLIMEMGVESFNHISDAVALVRPGPANSGMTAEYIRRKHGAKWEPMHKEYEKITKDTYGLLVYQEQVMQVISKMAGLPYSTADKVRKIIGKKRSVKEFGKYKDMFVRGCRKTGYFNKSEALKFWSGLEKWALYGFNKSHSVEYAILAYWCSWLKLYYPTEFVCASLTFGAEGKKKEIIEEAYKLGLRIMLPKVGKSQAINWEANQDCLYIPFIEVKGIGEKKAIQAASGIGDKPQGNIKKFFGKKKKNQVVKIGGKFGGLLDKIGAYDPHNPEITRSIKDLFKFRIVTNPKVEYKKLYRLFENNLRLDKLDPALNGDSKVLRQLVNRKKLWRSRSFSSHRKFGLCEKCDLRNECKAPVPPSPGKYPVAIIGEAPGKDEDEQREGFVGRSGNMIWKTLRSYKRELFHVSNIVKCFPSDSRKPSPEQIKTCSQLWLVNELKEVKPIVILSFGNTGLQFFRNQKSGITNISGKVIWNEYFGAWVVYCLHPAATMHNPDNKIYYDAGMKRFKELLKQLKFPKK